MIETALGEVRQHWRGAESIGESLACSGRSRRIGGGYRQASIPDSKHHVSRRSYRAKLDEALMKRYLVTMNRIKGRRREPCEERIPLREVDLAGNQRRRRSRQNLPRPLRGG